MSRLILLFIVLSVVWVPLAAAEVRIAVAEFKVTGASGKDELKSALQSLLASRLEGDGVKVVGAGESSDYTVVGNYIVFGKVFSIDSQIISRNGTSAGRVFEQGDGTDDVIPAIGRVAKKLSSELARLAGPVTQGDVVRRQSVVVPPVVSTPVSADIVRPVERPVQQGEPDIIKPDRSASAAGGAMIGQRLPGVMTGLVQLRRVSADNRDLVVSLERELRLYRQETVLTLQDTDKSFGSNEKIINIDAADGDGDGTTELYVTVVNGDQLASRVYQVENGKLTRIAGNLPYYFRSLAPFGAAQKLYAQQMGVSDDFYGDLFEVTRNGKSLALRNPIKLPKYATIYNVNMFRDADGRKLFVILHPDGFLLVSDELGENLWKSSDKFGGSEMAIIREDIQNMTVSGTRFVKRFIDQRITVTKTNDIIVPRNEGNFVIGNSRSFTKHSVYSFSWRGAALEEQWHTKVHQSYLADYVYDPDHKELLLLEVVKKDGIAEKGASVIAAKIVE